jgi:N-acetylmuramoyl-L-alanine amidase
MTSCDTKNLCVGLDAGHGGQDAGTKERDRVESAVTLEVVQTALAMMPEFKIVLTRADDMYLSIAQRVNTLERVGTRVNFTFHVERNTNQQNQYGLGMYFPKDCNAMQDVCRTVGEKLSLRFIDYPVSYEASNFYLVRKTGNTILVRMPFLMTTTHYLKDISNFCMGLKEGLNRLKMEN